MPRITKSPAVISRDEPIVTSGRNRVDQSYNLSLVPLYRSMFPLVRARLPNPKGLL